MNALKNATHFAILLFWMSLGILFSISSVFAHHELIPVLGFWMWFLGFSAVTTVMVKQFNSVIGALVTHAGFFVLLNVIPRVLPFSLLRLGYDLLAGR